jgi:SAM-dependent methyltransferase
MNNDIVSRRYTEGDYAEQNPEWDSDDSSWKAQHVVSMMKALNIEANSIVEIGCGAGGVLACVRSAYPCAKLVGFDIAPCLPKYWERYAGSEITFVLGDFLALNEEVVDVLLVLDVLEHLADPISFLDRLRCHGKIVVFHIPLDLSAVSVIRETPLLHVRHKVGHIHYFTRGLVRAMVEECGYEVLQERYTGAYLSAPGRSIFTKSFGLLRRIINGFNHDVGARLLGGETLMIVARPRRNV